MDVHNTDDDDGENASRWTGGRGSAEGDEDRISQVGSNKQTHQRAHQRAGGASQLAVLYAVSLSAFDRGLHRTKFWRAVGAAGDESLSGNTGGGDTWTRELRKERFCTP